MILLSPNFTGTFQKVSINNPRPPNKSNRGGGAGCLRFSRPCWRLRQGFFRGGLGSFSCFTQSPKSRATAASNAGPVKPERREASSSAVLYRRNISGFSEPEQNRKSYFAA